MYECTNNSITPVFDSILNHLQTVHSYNTRQASKGNIYSTGVNTTQYGKRSAKYAGGIIWNILSVELRKSPSVQIFKKNLQALFICLFSPDTFLTIILCVIVTVIIILLLQYGLFCLICSVTSFFLFIHLLFFFFFFCNIRYFALGVCCPSSAVFSLLLDEIRILFLFVPLSPLLLFQNLF